MCEESRSTGKVVIVDIKKSEQYRSLPDEVKSAIRKSGNYWPKVIMTDAAMSKVYGAYSYSQLKTQNFRSLFRDNRRAFEEDADKGTLPEPGASTAEDSGHHQKGEQASAFKTGDFEIWTSAAGSEIEARLIDFGKNGDFIFETREGKEIAVAPNQLSDVSRKRATDLIGGK